MLHGIMCICCGAIMADAHAGGKHPDGASAPLCVECVEAVMDGFRLHVVAVMVNKIMDGNVYSLMVQRAADNPQYALHWEDPGGKVEMGESFEAAARREMREELGLSLHVALHEVGQVRQPQCTVHAFTCLVPSHWEPELLEGQASAAWVTAQDRATHTPQLPSVAHLTQFLPDTDRESDTTGEAAVAAALGEADH